jgi:hypothetical protein
MIGVKDDAVQYDTISDGDKLKLIVLGFEFPKFYLDSIKESDFVKQEQAKAMGLPFTPTMPSHKEGGMVMKCAVIERNGKPTFTTVDQKIKLPNFFISMSINQLPLPMIHEKNKKMIDEGKFFGFFDQQKGLSSHVNSKGGLKVINIHPLSGIAQDFNSKVYANAIPLGFEDGYADLIKKEKERKADWESCVSIWNSLTENDAVTELFDGLSRRFILGYKEKKKFICQEPEVGMIFEGIAESKKARYWRLKTFQWNAEKKDWDIFSPVQTEPQVISEKRKRLAKAIEEAIKEDVEKRANAKAQKEAEEYDADKETLDTIVAEGVDDEDDFPWN